MTQRPKNVRGQADSHRQSALAVRLEVTIEISRYSFLKRGSEGHVDFISPIPCPFNYGSVREYLGGEGDYLDAVVLGPRLPRESQVVVNVWGAVGLSERGMYDDKLICGFHPVSEAERRRILQFFYLYARCKGWYNRLRGYSGDARCEGWSEAVEALQRAEPVSARRRAPRMRF